MDTTLPIFHIAELYDVELKNGIFAYFTSHRRNLSVNGNTYISIPLQRGAISFHSDLQVDKMDISFGIIGVTIGERNYSIPEVIRKGFLRNAKITLWYYDYFLKTATKKRFPCYVTGDVSFDGASCTVSCGSILDRLKNKIPTKVCSEFCQYDLFDEFCTVNKATYKVSSAVGANSTDIIIYSDIFLFSNHAEGYWGPGGEIVFSSGENQYVSAGIFSHYDGYVKLEVPLPDAPGVGDTFDAYPACNKTGLMCAETFDNYANFDGDEYAPRAEVMYG